MLPDRIGRYPVLGEIGRGASAAVYLGEDPFNHRQVAIKVARADADLDRDAAERFEKLFLNEASLAGRLHHPNIVQVYDAVVEGALRYIAMEYVPGGSLKKYCAPATLLPVRRVAEVVFKLARALDYAEQQGVVHRDVKSANILLAGDGEVKLSDFGAAHIAGGEHAQVGGFVGSPAYMAPEAVNEIPSGAQADIWSLGVVMYELLAGRLPFSGRSLMDLLGNIVDEHPQPVESLRPDVPAALARIVRRALAKPLGERYAAWDEFARDLVDSFRELATLGEELSFSEKFSRLRALEFFSGFGDEHLREVVASGRWERRDRGEPLAQPGDVGQALYVIVSGEAKVARGERFLGLLTPGDCFGELAGGADLASPSDAQPCAVSKVELLHVRADTLEQLSEGCQLRFTRAFLSRLITRLSAARAPVPIAPTT